MSRKFNRRRVLQGGGLVTIGAFGAALVGCGDDDDDAANGSEAPTPTAGNGSSGPVRGGTLRRVHSNDTEHLDPALDTANLMHFGAGQLYAKLIRWNAEGNELLPDLAESLPEITDDGLRYIFKLRPGLKFSDGSPLTSRDVAFTYMRLADPDLKSPHQYKVGPLEAVDTPDDQTVVMRLARPFAPFLSFAGSAWLFILSQAAVEQSGPRFQETVFSGPYRIARRQPSVSTTFERNPEYYDPERPYPDTIELKILPDQASMDAALIAEDADYLGSIFDAARVETFLKANSNLNDFKYPVRHAQLFLFNTESGPFADERLRRAVSMLIDRDEYIRVVLTTGGKASGPVPWAFEEFALPESELAKKPGYRKPKDEDIAEARALMEAAGVGGGFKVVAPTLAGPSPYNSQSVFLQSHLQQYGIELDLQIVDFPTLNERRNSGTFDAMAYINGGSQEIDEMIYGPNYTGQARNVNRFSDPEIDRLLDEQRMEIDPDRRKELITEIQHRLLDAQPTAWLADPYYHTIATARLGGYRGVPVFDWGAELHDVYIDESAKGGLRPD